MALTKHQTLILEGLAAHLESLSTPGARGCGLPDEVKEAVRVYVRSWCLPLVREMLDPTAEAEARRNVRLLAELAIWR